MASTATNWEETIVTVTFEPIEDGTRLTLVHVGLPDATAAGRHEGGWQNILAARRSASFPAVFLTARTSNAVRGSNFSDRLPPAQKSQEHGLRRCAFLMI